MSSQTDDILDEMSKPELLDWLRRNVFLRPKLSELLSIRWARQSSKLEADWASEMEVMRGFDFNHRTQLWSQYNQEPDRYEKLKILEQIQDFNERYAKHTKRCAALDVRGKKVDALYEQIDVARYSEGHNSVDRHDDPCHSPVSILGASMHSCLTQQIRPKMQ